MRVKKEKTRMIRTQIQITQRQASELKRLAAGNGASMAEWIRKAIDALIREADEPSWEERKKRALAVVGIGHSDCDDIAENHDAYLEEIYLGRKP